MFSFQPFRRGLLALCLAWSSSAVWAAPSAIEQLLLEKDYARFQTEAREAASGGGAAAADALFLLGKACHLGLGIEVDAEQAIIYYQQAATLGSPRALHNLGSLLLERGERGAAIRFFQQALDAGLREPTLYNLGRAHDLTRSQLFGLADERAMLLTAASYYEQAYALSGDAAVIGDIVRVRSTAWRIVADEADRHELMKWVNLGVAREVATVFQNYGAMLYYSGDRAAARPWFEKAQARGVLAATHALGLLEKDAGDPAGLAEGYFLRAARAGFAEALDELSRIYGRRLRAEQGIEALAALLAQVDELRPLARKHDASWPPHAYKDAAQRLARMRFIAEKRGQPSPLPAGQISLRLCLTDIEGAGGFPLVNEPARVVALSVPTDEPLGFDNGPHYRTDRRGCLSSSSSDDAWFRQRLAAGDSLFLIRNSHAVPLQVVGDRQRFQLRPLDLEQAAPGDGRLRSIEESGIMADTRKPMERRHDPDPAPP